MAKGWLIVVSRLKLAVWMRTDALDKSAFVDLPDEVHPFLIFLRPALAPNRFSRCLSVLCLSPFACRLRVSNGATLQDPEVVNALKAIVHPTGPTGGLGGLVQKNGRRPRGRTRASWSFSFHNYLPSRPGTLKHHEIRIPNSGLSTSMIVLGRVTRFLSLPFGFFQ